MKETPTAKDWFEWNYGKRIAEMTDRDLARYARVAWDVNDGDQLRAFRAEAARRGIQVA